MATENKIILDSFDNPFFVRRRKLLPWWIKTFCWIFMITGSLVGISFIIGIFGLTVDLSLYGLKTNQPFSLIGTTILVLFSLKGFAAYGLWYEKDWAIIVAKIDAAIGIAICFLLTFITPGQTENNGMFIKYTFSLRAELILLIPYLIKISVIKDAWKQSATTA